MSVTFDHWINRRFSSPIDILRDDLTQLSQVGAKCNALISDDVLRSLDFKHFSGQGPKIYLPNLKGVKDSKQYAVIKIGTTGNNVPIPIVIFRSYRTSFDTQAVYSPAAFLWREYRHNKTQMTPDTNINNGYQKATDQAKEQYESLKEERKQLAIAAFDASQVALRRLYQNSQCTQQLPNYLKEKGITKWIPDESRICHSSVSANLYIKSRDHWRQLTIAYPRDILIPVYDLENRNVINIQIVSARDTRQKRFLPGAPTMNLSLRLNQSDINPKQSPPIFVVLEGYRTAKACEFLHYQTDLDIDAIFVMGLAANNLPGVISKLKSEHPDSLVLAGFDRDAINTDYARHAISMGAALITPPDHHPKADWADVTKDYPETAVTMWRNAFYSALTTAIKQTLPNHNK
ncbi:hypothetical protein AB9X29_003713 [Vibrio vulnificus]